MNYLRIKRLGTGMHPREVIVTVETRGGPEQVAAFDNLLSGDRMQIGYPLDEADGFILVELPGETAKGVWRVWVKREDVFSDAPEYSSA